MNKRTKSQPGCLRATSVHLLTEALQDRRPSLVHDGPKATRDHSTICDVFFFIFLLLSSLWKALFVL